MFVVSVLKLPWTSAIRSITSNASGSAVRVLLHPSNTVKTLRHRTASISLHLSALNEAKKISRQETERIIKPNLIDLPSTHLSDLSADEE